MKTVLAIDLGAESGRVMAVHFDGTSLELEELHRFTNPSTMIHGTLYWDFLHLWRNIQHGIEKGQQHNPASLGVDTWGVDFGLLDANGNLVANPVHYRDDRTEGMLEKAFATVPQAEIYKNTGIQFMRINTLYQLLSMADSPVLDIAETFLTAPDLLNYWLTGAKVCEFTNATTTQMLNPATKDWARDMLNKLNIPTHILPEIAQPGTRIGTYDNIPVITPACHDTGSAVAGVPTQSNDFAYISSGTWSLVGLEVPDAIVSDAAFEANMTNEGGVYDTYRFLKNVMGLWILQQCRTTWGADKYSYDDLVVAAEGAEPLQYIFDVDDERFLGPGNHPELIQAWFSEHNLSIPQTVGEITRAVLESLALKYGQVLNKLTTISGQHVSTIHIVGGGSQNRLLNQFTANATGCEVVTGPIEATVIGNAMVQLIALGELGNIQEARQLLASLPNMQRYTPENTAAWQAKALNI